MAADPPKDDRLTVLAIGCVAALASAAGHEAVGHGASCLAVGGRIMLLTTTHFGCLGGTPLVDAAGPAMNLLLAGLGALGFAAAARSSPSLRSFFLALCVFNVFWFAGEALHSSLSGREDEANLARGLGWPPWWRGACAVAALAVYAAGVRAFVDPLRRSGAGRPRAAALLAGGAIALTLAGLCSRKDPIGGAWEGFLAVGVASAPMLISAGAAVRRGLAGPRAGVTASWTWRVLAIVSLALFCLTQGRGVGPQA